MDTLVSSLHGGSGGEYSAMYREEEEEDSRKLSLRITIDESLDMYWNTQIGRNSKRPACDSKN